MFKAPINFYPSFMELHLWIKANTKKQGFLGLYQDHIALGIKAQAKEGEANRAIIEFLASYFKVPKSQIILVSGFKSRFKCFRLPLHEQNKEISSLLLNTLNI